MKKSDMPIVKVSFSLIGKKMNFNDITNRINILPSETRDEDDWPEAIKNNPDLPGNLKPRCIWTYTISKKSCLNVNIPFIELVDIFYSKTDDIKEIIKNNAETCIEILVHSDAMNMPIIGLSRENISFLNKIEAEVEFDIYTY